MGLLHSLDIIGSLFRIKHNKIITHIGNFEVDKCYNLDCRLGLEQLPNESIDTIITDCPFAIKNGSAHTENYNRNGDNVMEGYQEIPIEEYASFSEAWISGSYRVLTKKGTLCIVSSWTNQREILNAIHKNHFYLQNQLIFKYNFGLFTKKKLVSSHYNIFICSKHKTDYTFNKLNWYCEDVISASEFDIEILDIKREYWTNKIKTPNKLPKELVEMLVFYYTNPDDKILDCFSGSGTILKVSTALGRYCLSFEIVKHYADFSNYRKNQLDY